MLKRKMMFDYLRIFAGVFLVATSITVFYQPNDLVTGGVSGLCIIIASYARKLYSVDTPLYMLSILFNLPLLISGYFVLGREFIWKTIVASVSLSAALYLTTFLPRFHGDYVIVAIFGGVLMGTGVGLTLRSYCTTGGSDLLASIIHKLNRAISVANAILVLDSAVIAVGVLVFGIQAGMYAIVSVYISTKVIDGILEGLNFSKGAFIMSKKSEEISDAVQHSLNRGVTGLKGQGMYTKGDVTVLLCVVAKKEIIRLKDIVNATDPNAFMIITDVREALGEGFAPH